MTDEVWATILALIWLHDVKLDAKEEWNLLAQKAMSWLQANDGECSVSLLCSNVFRFFVLVFCSGLILLFNIAAPYSTKCVDVGNSVLGCKVQKEALGL